MAKKKRTKRINSSAKRPAAMPPALPPALPPLLPEIGFVRLPVVRAHVGLGKSTLWQMVREKEFPAPVRLSARNVGWNVTALRDWIAARISAAVS